MRESDRFEGRGVTRAHCKVGGYIVGGRQVSEVAIWSNLTLWNVREAEAYHCNLEETRTNS